MSFAYSGGGVGIDSDTGEFIGHAWSENLERSDAARASDNVTGSTIVVPGTPATLPG